VEWSRLWSASLDEPPALDSKYNKRAATYLLPHRACIDTVTAVDLVIIARLTNRGRGRSCLEVCVEDLPRPSRRMCRIKNSSAAGSRRA
jgi:hypothetical protein